MAQAGSSSTMYAGAQAANAVWYACLQRTVERSPPKVRVEWGAAMMAAVTPQQQRTLVFPQHGVTAPEVALVLADQVATARASKTAAERLARQQSRT